MNRIWTAVLVAAVLSTACSQPDSSGPSQESAAGTAGSVVYEIPAGWQEEKPRSAMRQAQYRLARAEGDIEDGELAVFHFPGEGGSIRANVDRWVGQFSDENGQPLTEPELLEEKTVNGTRVTIVGASGTYSASMGGPMSPRTEKPGFRMLAAIIETPDGPWFFKLTGPQATISKWEASFQEFTDSLRLQ